MPSKGGKARDPGCPCPNNFPKVSPTVGKGEDFYFKRENMTKGCKIITGLERVNRVDHSSFLRQGSARA